MVFVDAQVFQGIGPSKKRAKIMASERALAYIGAIDENEVHVPELETPHVDDPTADVFTGLIYSNFGAPDVSVDDASLKLPFYQPEGMKRFEEYDTYTMQDAFEGYVGCNAVQIMSEMRADAQYEIVYAAASANPTRFVTSVRVRGRTYCGDAKNKKISKGRAAATALTDIYGIEFGTAEGQFVVSFIVNLLLLILPINIIRKTFYPYVNSGRTKNCKNHKKVPHHHIA